MTVTYVSKSKVSHNSLCVYIKKQDIDDRKTIGFKSKLRYFLFLIFFSYMLLGKYESRFISELLLRLHTKIVI